MSANIAGHGGTIHIDLRTKYHNVSLGLSSLRLFMVFSWDRVSINSPFFRFFECCHLYLVHSPHTTSLQHICRVIVLALLTWLPAIPPHHICSLVQTRSSHVESRSPSTQCWGRATSLWRVAGCIVNFDERNSCKLPFDSLISSYWSVPVSIIILRYCDEMSLSEFSIILGVFKWPYTHRPWSAGLAVERLTNMVLGRSAPVYTTCFGHIFPGVPI